MEFRGLTTSIEALLPICKTRSIPECRTPLRHCLNMIHCRITEFASYESCQQILNANVRTNSTSYCRTDNTSGRLILLRSISVATRNDLFELLNMIWSLNTQQSCITSTRFDYTIQNFTLLKSSTGYLFLSNI